MKSKSTIILYLLPLVLFLLPQLTYQIGFVTPLTPFGATFVNTKLPSIYNLHFSLTSGLRSDAYIRVKFANYTTLGTATCLFNINPLSPNLKATTSKACTVVGDSVYLAPGVAIVPTDEIYYVIFLSQPIPDTPGYTNLFQVSTVSSTDQTTAVIFDINPGFGNFLWGSYSDVGTLFLEGLDFGVPATRNLQGAANSVQVHVRFNRAFTAKYSRILVVVDMPWKFGATTITLAKSSLYDVAVAANQPTGLYTAPTIFNFEIINDQVIQVYFNETFPEGREFLMTVSNIINPIAISSGKLRFYTTDYTSNSVLEANENTVIYTASNTIPITLSLGAGVPYGTGPVKLYKNTEQYLKILFPVGATTIMAGTTIKYEFSTDNTPLTGTLFISPTFSAQDGTKVAYVYDTNSITLSNLGPLVSSTNVYIQTKIKFSKIQPTLQVKISIIYNGVVVKYGESDILSLETNANSAVPTIKGNNGESGVLDLINTPTKIVLSFTTESRVSSTGSTITIYSNSFITQSGMTCSTTAPGATFSTCTLASSGTYSVFTLTSAAGKNVIPTGTYDVTINGITLQKPSSHQEAIYEFYIRVDRDGTGKTLQDLMVYAFVRPDRTQLTNLYQFHTLDVYSNNLANFPSFIRVFGTSSALTALAPTGTEQVVITINSFVSLANFLQVSNEGAFPCGSNLAITCNYIKGNPNALITNPIDWDRVIITLPNSATSNAFNLYIPQFFTTNQYFEFIVGKYDPTTRIYQNTYLEPQYTINPTTSTGFTVTASGLVSNEPNLYIDLRGQRAGVLIPSTSPITLSFETLTGFNPNDASNFGASAVVITEWEFWNSQSILNPVITNVYDPLSNNPQDATVYLRYITTAGDAQNAVIFPVIASGNPQKLFNIGQVEMPYSLDIPNYVVYMTDKTGHLTYYNTLINSGRNALISSAITNYNFKCTHMIQSYLNTYCTMIFTTNAKIDRQAKIKIAYTSAFITISQCSLSYVLASSTTVNPVSSSFYSCSSALQEIVISFNMANRLPVATYTLNFYGFDQGSGTSQGLTFSIWDANYGFIVEQTNYNYFLELAIPDVISIDSINYDYLNLDSISNFRLKFTLPRDIYPNEILEFDIGADLQSNNKNTDRLSIVLAQITTPVTRVQIYGALKSQILTVQFGQGVQLAAGSYEIGLLNLKTPTTHSTDKVKVRLRRSTDNVFVMQSKESSFTSYPVLQLGASSFVKVVNSRFLCVGCMGEFTFQVTLSNSYIDANSIVYLHFPSYFLPAIANQQAKIDCRFNLDPVVCDTQSDYPYRLRLTGSPMYLNPGDTFNITVYGFIVPNVVTDTSSQQDLFFAVDSLFNGTFSEQSNVILPSLANIKSGMGSMYFYNLVMSSNIVRDKIDHVLRVNTTSDLPIGSTVSVTFTNDYSNIRYLASLTCKLNVYIYGVLDTGYSGTTCAITGQTVKFVLTKAISKAYSLELTIYSVPAPPKVTTLDPNQFIIAGFGVDENDVIAISRETLNSIYKVDFVDATNTIEAQSNTDINITRGTFSSDIFIGTNGGKRIIQDVSITAIATGFTFVPSIIEFFVGDISHTFRVGCDQNVKLRTYPFNFTQTQDEALVNAYGDLFNVRVNVIDTPVVITVPTTVVVPIGGSSLPIAVLLTQRPYKEVQILMDIDDDFFNGAFGVDLDYSSPSLNFTSNDGLKYICFFSTSAISSFPSTFTVSLKLDGANYQSYQLSSTSITIQIQSLTFGSASILGTVGTIKKTQASFSITQDSPGSEGMLLVQLAQSCAAQKSLSEIKNILRNNSFATTTLTSNGCTQKFLNYVYNTPATPMTLSLTDLTPETKHNLYVYFENKGKQSNSASPYTYTFSTLPLDSTVKMTATFKQTVYLDQLNSLICFLLRLFQTRITNVVDAGGLSCSSYIEPTNRFLDYTGDYFGNYANSFSFYLLPDPTLEIDSSLSSVPLYFDSNNLANTLFYTAAAGEGITFINQFKLDYYFTYNQAKTSTGNINMPVLQSFTNDIITVDGNSTIRITNFKMSARGSIYTIAREIAKVTVDPEDEFTTTDTTTRIPRTPSSAQIYACQDWNGDKVDACGRAVIANDDTVELQLRDLKVNTMYIVYYIVTNEYPIEPIFGSDIQSFTVRVLNNAGILVMGWIALLGCIMTLFM